MKAKQFRCKVGHVSFGGIVITRADGTERIFCAQCFADHLESIFGVCEPLAEAEAAE